MKQPTSPSIQSLYAHFPFCEARCHYCDFYSIGRERVRTGDTDRFEKALKTELSTLSSQLHPELQTLFFGGGTPSMTNYDSMARAFEPIWKTTKINESTEWTLEANPSSIALDSFKAYRSYGINRVSMGVQALRPDLLKLLGRVHSRETALNALDSVFSAGFDNVSVDLLCGVPGQTQADLDDALALLTQFPITHLSCYLLTLPPHHKMYSQLPNEDVQLQHLLHIHDWMTDHDFTHYEISNFAKTGKQSQHNMRYWQGHSYLGFGPSAHSFDSLTQTRWKNVSSLHKYAELLEQEKSPIDSVENLTPTQTELEKWMLSLRLDKGFPAEWLTPNKRAHVRTFTAEGLLEVHPENPERIRLTPKGFALSDGVIRALA